MSKYCPARPAGNFHHWDSEGDCEFCGVKGLSSSGGSAMPPTPEAAISDASPARQRRERMSLVDGHSDCDDCFAAEDEVIRLKWAGHESPADALSQDSGSAQYPKGNSGPEVGALADRRIADPESASVPEPSHDLYAGGPCQDCGQPVIKLERGWTHVFQGHTDDCQTPGLGDDVPTAPGDYTSIEKSAWSAGYRAACDSAPKDAAHKLLMALDRSELDCANPHHLDQEGEPVGICGECWWCQVGAYITSHDTEGAGQ